MPEAPVTPVGKWEAALELLRAAALHEQNLVEFYTAVQNVAKKDGYDLCRSYELARLESDYRELKIAVHNVSGAASKTAHTPRHNQFSPTT